MVDYEQDIKNCVAAMQAGGVILYPTDTTWGLGCDATNEAAVQKIFTVKRRVQEKSLIVLLAEARDILRWVATPHPDIIALVDAFDRPTTVIYEHGLGFAEGVTGSDGSIGIRVTKDPFCKALIKRFRKPIVSTSANISGQPAPTIFADISQEIIDHVDYTVQYRRYDREPKQPSKIVKINDDGSMVVLRG